IDPRGPERLDGAVGRLGRVQHGDQPPDAGADARRATARHDDQPRSTSGWTSPIRRSSVSGSYGAGTSTIWVVKPASTYSRIRAATFSTGPSIGRCSAIIPSSTSFTLVAIVSFQTR